MIYSKVFPKGLENRRTHHLNLVIFGDPEQWDEKLLFRDCLRQNSDMRDEYAARKAELAQRYANNREAYTSAKHEFIEEVIKQVQST